MSNQTKSGEDQPSPITPALVARATAGVGEPRLFEGTLYWLEHRPSEGGRVALMKATAGERTELTPPPYSARSRVHEYGGAAYLPTQNAVFFINTTDQNIYAVDADGEIQQITTTEPTVRYADLCLDQKRGRLIAVTEIHQHPDEPVNALAGVDIGTGEATILHQGHDFYAAPRVSPSGGEILFIAWDHPNMPWDGTHLLCAPLNIGIGETTLIAGGGAESVLQPSWLRDGSALYLSDANGFWNLHRANAWGTWAVLDEEAEYAGPPWQFGNQDYAVLNQRQVVARRQSDGEQTLVLIDLATGTPSPLPDDCAEYSYFSADNDSVYFLGAHTGATSEIAKYDIHEQRRTTLVPGPTLDFDSAWLSRPRHIEYQTRDGGRAYAWLYLPANTRAMPSGNKPPLLVTTHGGPTGAASPALRLAAQFYTSRGWVVADINYRGSTGYGKRYRDALRGQWGVVDVGDCADAVRHLIAEGLVDPERIAIRGSSAGGYTTLRALTTETVFRAGASHYGIGDLSSLAEDTHKFESRYLFGLIGDEEAMVERSPIAHLDGFNCPVIFFQGAEDRIVPPNQAQSMVAALNRQGIPVAYLEFPGEGHGFREGTNIAKTIGAEYAFFCRVFDIPVNEDLPDISIENQ